ncbi:MAG TPA: hypothetical protein VGG49_07595 [Steroidobacteraceae bacterium]|jgi:hypothetical protein
MYVIRSPMRATGKKFGTVLAALLAAMLARAPVHAQGNSSAPGVASASSSAPARQATHGTKKPRAAPPAAMDLHPPPLNHIYPRSELQYILADNSDTQVVQDVDVKGEKYVAPPPLGQFRAIPWAILHPTEAWRIFTPLEQP